MTNATRPLRVAHLADTHLGLRHIYKTDPATGRNQRSVDLERAYETVISDILTREVDLVVHGGDVFHHTRPSWQALRCFIRQTRRLTDAGLPVVVIAGNHDTPRLRTSGSAFSVLDLALPEVIFVTGYDQASLPFQTLDVTVHAVPHGKLTDIMPPLVIPQPGTRNILVTHGLVPGMAIKGRHEPGEEEISDTLLDTDFDYIALGHYHVSSKQRHNAWYSGSTERTTWGDEAATPGYLLAELGAPGDPPEVHHIPIEARPMKTLDAVDGEGRTARDIADVVLERLARLGLPEAMVRVELKNALRPVRREAESILRREATAFVWHLQTYSAGDLFPRSGEQRAEAAALDIRALFAEFIDERVKAGAYDDAFAEAFRQRGAKALDDAIRAADSTDGEDVAA